jgi:hypothetical protein
MYVINGIPEIRKMGTGIPIFDLNGFQVFRFDFPPENSGIPELGSGIPNSGRPRNRNPKTEFPTKGVRESALVVVRGPRRMLLFPPFSRCWMLSSLQWMVPFLVIIRVCLPCTNARHR